MKIIKEYLLDKKSTDLQTLYLPTGAEPAAIQDTSKGLMLYYLVNPTIDTTELHTFKVCTIESPIYSDATRYLGNFKSLVGIKHVLEVL